MCLVVLQPWASESPGLSHLSTHLLLAHLLRALGSGPISVDSPCFSPKVQTPEPHWQHPLAQV